MIKRRLIAAVLCITLLACMLSGCGNNKAKEDFKALWKKAFSLTEMAVKGEINAELNAEYDPDEGYELDITDSIRDISANIKLDGTVSLKNKQINADADFNISAGEGKSLIGKLTDILIDDNILYMNFRQVFDILLEEGIEGFDYDSLFSSDYVYLPLSEGTNLWKARTTVEENENTDIFAEALKDMPNTLKVIMKIRSISDSRLKGRLFTSGLNKANLTLNKNILLTIITDIINDADSNRELYADALVEVAWAAEKQKLEDEGASEMEIMANYNTLKASGEQIQKMIPVVKTVFKELDKSQIPDFELNCGIKEVADNEFAFEAGLVVEDVIKLEYSGSVKETAPERVTPLEGAMPYSDIAGLLSGDEDTMEAEEVTINVRIVHGDGTVKQQEFKTQEYYLLDAIYYYFGDEFIGGKYDDNYDFTLLTLDGETADTEAGEKWTLTADGEAIAGDMDYVFTYDGVTYEFTFVK